MLMSSQSGSVKNEIKFSKLFEPTLASSNRRYMLSNDPRLVNLPVQKLVYFMWFTFNISVAIMCKTAESRSALAFFSLPRSS